MYFLTPLIFFSNNLTAAHNDTQATGLSATNNSTRFPSTSGRSIKTVYTTVTKTLSPVDTLTISTSTTGSHFAILPLPTEGVYADEHDNCTSSRPYTLGHGPVVVTTDLGFYPIITASNSDMNTANPMNSTDLPKFTLDEFTASTSIPFIGHYTLAGSSHNHSAYTTTTVSTKSYLVSSTVSGSASHTPNAGFSSNLRTASAYHAPSTYEPPPTSGERGVAMSILPIGEEQRGKAMPVFHWPSIIASSLSSPAELSKDSEVAWAGTDNAIPAQLHDRSLPHLSSQPLQSESAAVPRVQIFWRDSVRRAPPQNLDIGHDGAEERECTSCDEEGKAACRGDVAIGVCKGGCVEYQFLGRGQGNGCEDD